MLGRASGARRAELEGELALPPMPPAGLYLWTAFIRLRRRCASSGLGPGPIRWADIDAFSQWTGLRLAPWEVEIIEAIDDAWLKEQGKKRE